MPSKHNQPVAEFITQSDLFHRSLHAIYEPLEDDDNGTQIRLMHILPGRFEDEKIEVTLSAVDIDTDPEHKPHYEALSYTWGSLHPTKTILLCNVPYEVTANQHAALRRLRLPWETRTIWMDVTCINQADVVERNRQVAIMGRIYASAAQTRVWLGEPEPEWSEITDYDWDAHVIRLNSSPEVVAYMTRRAGARSAEIMREFLEVVTERSDGILKGALYFLKLLGEHWHIRDMPYCYLGEGGELLYCRAFYEVLEMTLSLLKRPWWTRVWVLQEACLSTVTPLVHIGSQVASIRAITDAHDGWTQSWSDWRRDDSCLGEVYDHAAFIQGFARLSTYGSALEMIAHKFGRLKLPIGMGLVNERNAGDRRDFVYGIMGVIPPDSRIAIDYGLNVAEVFALASWVAFSEYAHGFDMLKEAAGVSATDIPSWVVDWAKRNNAHFIDSVLFETGEEYDSDRAQCFHVAGVLQVTANKIDKIKTVLGRSQDPDVHITDQASDVIQGWVRQLHAMKILPESDLLANPPESIVAFLMTIFRETRKNKDGKMLRCASDEDWTEVIQWFSESRRGVDTNDTELKLQASESRVATDFQHAVNGASLCVTEQGCLCLAAETTQAGDVLHHVRGCCVPLALRPNGPFNLQWTEEDDGLLLERVIEPFKVVGPCYLRGSMGLDGASPADETVIYLV